jgi:uncharacterized protein (DUF2336 family)
MEPQQTMSERQSLIDTLEQAMAHKDIAIRAELFRAVTKLFVSSAHKLSDEHVGLFDDVMGCMLKEIDQSARAEFGGQIADIPNAPPRLIDTLSRDDSIDVAGPILSRSEQLDEASLVETAKTKSQEHLLAISRRRSLGEAVTDVLVERGDQRVAISVVGNTGAKFSEFGFSKLVKRAQSDDDLALGVFSRHEIPRQHLLNLFQSASESVRQKLEAADPRKADLIRDMVEQASDQIQAKSREGSAEFAVARALVESLNKAGKLTEAQLCDFARTGKFDETVVTISLICDMPFGVVERAIVNDSTDQLVVLVKSAGFSWDTAKTVLLMASKAKSRSKQDLERFYESFSKLRPETAKKAVQFYRFREKSAQDPAN